MTEKILEIEREFIKPSKPFDKNKSLELIFNYAKFLKQPLKLEMFVPCDDEGNVLEEPDRNNQYCIGTSEENSMIYYNHLGKYEDAKEKVLFEGYKLGTSSMMSGVFAISNDLADVIHFDLDDTIETMLGHISNLTLTESALKQIGI